MKPTLIKRIAVHKSAHADELGAAALVLEAGKFPLLGIESAIVVSMDLRHMTQEACLEQGILPIGQCGGDCDDKTSNGSRIPHACSMSRTAVFLGIEGEELKEIIDAVRKVDEKAVAVDYDLSKIIKTGMDIHPEKEADITAWGLKAFRALIRYKLSGAKGVPKCPFSLREMFEKRYRDIPDADVYAYVYRIMEKAEINRANPIGLQYVLGALSANGANPEEVRGFAEVAMDLLVDRQFKFREALEEVHSGVLKRQELFTPWINREISAVLINSDNPLITQAIRCCDQTAGLIIVRNSAGHVSILFNSQHQLEGKMLRALIRVREADPRIAANAHLEHFQSDGRIDEVPNWYAMECGHMLCRQRTRLSDSDLLSIAKNAFSFKALQEFNECVFHAQGASYPVRERNHQTRRPVPVIPGRVDLHGTTEAVANLVNSVSWGK